MEERLGFAWGVGFDADTFLSSADFFVEGWIVFVWEVGFGANAFLLSTDFFFLSWGMGAIFDFDFVVIVGAIFFWEGIRQERAVMMASSAQQMTLTLSLIPSHIDLSIPLQ